MAADTADTAKAIELLRRWTKPMQQGVYMTRDEYTDLVECFAAAVRRKAALDKMFAHSMQEDADAADGVITELSKELDTAEDELDTAIANLTRGVLNNG